MGDGSGLRGIGLLLPEAGLQELQKVSLDGAGQWDRRTMSSTAQLRIRIRAWSSTGMTIWWSIHSSVGFGAPTGRTIVLEDAFRIATSSPISGGMPGFPGSPKTAELEEFKFRVNEAFEPIYLNGCDDYVLMSIFNHASHTSHDGRRFQRSGPDGRRRATAAGLRFQEWGKVLRHHLVHVQHQPHRRPRRDLRHQDFSRLQRRGPILLQPGDGDVG